MKKIAYFLIYDPEHLREEIFRLYPNDFDKMKTYHQEVISAIKKWKNLQYLNDTEIHLFLNPDVGELIQVGDRVSPGLIEDTNLMGINHVPEYMLTKGEGGVYLEDDVYLWNTGGYGEDFNIRVIERRIDLDSDQLSIVLRSVFY